MPRWAPAAFDLRHGIEFYGANVPRLVEKMGVDGLLWLGPSDSLHSSRWLLRLLWIFREGESKLRPMSETRSQKSNHSRSVTGEFRTSFDYLAEAELRDDDSFVVASYFYGMAADRVGNADNGGATV